MRANRQIMVAPRPTTARNAMTNDRDELHALLSNVECENAHLPFGVAFCYGWKGGSGVRFGASFAAFSLADRDSQ